MRKRKRRNRTIKLQRRSPRPKAARKKMVNGVLRGCGLPANGDRELRAIMKEFVRSMAVKKGTSPEEYEKRIRRDGTYSTMRRLCHRLLFLVERVCDEVRAQEARRHGVLTASKNAAA